MSRAAGRELADALARAVELGRNMVRVLEVGRRDGELFSTARAARRAAAASSRSTRACSRTTRKYGWCPECFGTGVELAGVRRRAKRRGKRVARTPTRAVCAACDGRRLKPEALAVRFHGETIAEVTARSIADSLAYFKKLKLEARERDIARDVTPELVSRLGFLDLVGLGLSDARPRGADALGRRSTAHQARGAARLELARRLLHPRRADDRPASARQRAAAHDDREARGEGQHGRRRRARRGDDSPRRACRRLGPRRRAQRRRGRRQRLVRGSRRLRTLGHGPSSRGAAEASAARAPQDAQERRPRRRLARARRRRAPQPAQARRRAAARAARLRNGRQRQRQEHADPRRARGQSRAARRRAARSSCRSSRI